MAWYDILSSSGLSACTNGKPGGYSTVQADKPWKPTVGTLHHPDVEATLLSCIDVISSSYSCLVITYMYHYIFHWESKRESIRVIYKPEEAENE